MNGRTFRLVAATLGSALIALVGGSLALAQGQPPADPELQGRLLRRGDGALFLYKDGLRYPVAPLDVPDAQLDTIPQAGLVVVRVPDLYATARGTAATTTAGSTTAAPAPNARLAPTGAPLEAALQVLVGQEATVCDVLRNPLALRVERAEMVASTNGRPRVLLVVSVTNIGATPAIAMPSVQLRDEGGRRFAITTVGLDISALSREYGLPYPVTTDLQPGITQQQLWGFEMPAEVGSLTLDQNPLTRCGNAAVSPLAGASAS
jgi:hypothetical protein